MYDKDGSGTIELPEMIEIIGTLYEMEGVSKVSRKPCLLLQTSLFPKLGHNVKMTFYLEKPVNLRNASHWTAKAKPLALVQSKAHKLQSANFLTRFQTLT